MKGEVRKLADECWKIVADFRSSRIEVLTALSLIAATKGLLIPTVDEKFLSAKQIFRLRQMQHDVVEKALKQKAAKKKRNRKHYLRRRVREIESTQAPKTKGPMTLDQKQAAMRRRMGKPDPVTEGVDNNG